MYEDLADLIARKRVAFPEFGNGVSEKVIDDAEMQLKIKFSDSYRWWLKNYGGGQIQGDLVYGLDPEGLAPDIVELFKIHSLDNLYTKQQLVFCMGNDEHFFFDLNSFKNGEYAVINHDVSCNEYYGYANSFADFLYRRIKELYK